MTKTFVTSDVDFGLFGYFDGLTHPDVWHLQAAASNWTVSITGTDAQMNASNGQGYWVSVDGGAFTNPAVTGNKLPLFSGLPDAPHVVQVCGDPSYTPIYNYVAKQGDYAFAFVTGSDPKIDAGTKLGPKFFLNDPSYPGVYSGQTTPNTPDLWNNDANITPTRPIPGGNPLGSTKFRAKCSSLWAFTDGGFACFGVDGGPLTKVALTGDRRCWRLVASGLDATTAHEYAVTAGSNWGVMIGGVGATFEPYSAKRLLQVGDSITWGVSADNWVDLDFFRYAQFIPYVAQGAAVPGYSTNQILGLLSAAITSSNGPLDCIVIAAGRNDNPSTTNLQPDYTSLINAALAAVGSGGVVLCRLPTPNYTLVNSILSAAVASVNDPRVHLIDTSGWTGIATIADQTHPTTPGYATLADYEAAAYGPILATPAPATNTFPADNQVVAGVKFIVNGVEHTGSYTAPTSTDPGAANVLDGVAYQIGGSARTGSYVVPISTDPGVANVVAPTAYKFAGQDRIGTYTPSSSDGGTGTSPAELVVALLNAEIEPGETLRQTLLIGRAFDAGKAVRANGITTIMRKDGTTPALTVAHDLQGNRTSSTTGDLS